MHVFLTGATGFIGGHTLRALVAHGHTVTCLVRPGGVGAIQRLGYAGVQAVEGEFTRPETWTSRVAGHDAVINAVGIIRETSRGSFEQVHTQAPIALFEAAAQAGARKIVQISALGADAQAASRYHRSKRAADERLATLGVPHVVLRPSFVYGPGDHSMTFFRSLAAQPVTGVPGDGQYRVQPVHIDDLVRSITAALERDDLRQETIDIVGAASVSFDELLHALARTLGKRRAVLLHVPLGLMRLVAQTTDLLGRGPITSEELGMLLAGNAGDAAPMSTKLGVTPVSFETGLARTGLSPADALAARLAWLRAPLRLSIAFIWVATGLISALASAAEGFAILAQIGVTGGLAQVALYGTSAFEVLIGLATAAGWQVRWMALIQLLLMAGFTAILTWGLPEFWLHPFGPLTKNVPLAAATLVMLAWESQSPGGEPSASPLRTVHAVALFPDDC